MTEILLIIALCIAIVLDIIRVVQYRAVNKMNRPRAIREFLFRARKLCDEYYEIKKHNLFNNDLGWIDYCVEHWDDEENK